jgi:hypothetical protein
MTLSKPTHTPAPTVARTPKQRRLDALYRAEQQRLATVRAALAPEDRALLHVVHAQQTLEHRRNGHAQAVIHCPIGTRLLQTECHNNTQRAWYFLTDTETGEVWCVFILASTHYLNRSHGGSVGGGDGSIAVAAAVDPMRLLADTVVRHAHNQPADVALAQRVQAHLQARRPLKVFRRCDDNEMEAIGYGRAAGAGGAFVHTTAYPSVAALVQAYPMLAKPKNARRAGNAVGHPQVRFDLVVRSTPWSTPDDEATDHAAPTTTVSHASQDASPPPCTSPADDWPTLLAVMGAAK